MPTEMLIPLFPLGLVLFPHMPLPLHIFEERYKTMIRECLEEDKVFGVVYFSGDQIHLAACDLPRQSPAGRPRPPPPSAPRPSAGRRQPGAGVCVLCAQLQCRPEGPASRILRLWHRNDPLVLTERLIKEPG